MERKETDARLAEIFPEGYTEVRNSPETARKFYGVAILGVVIECMALFFFGMILMDDGVEWTGKLFVYVALCAALPILIVVEGMVGARLVSRERICFDKKTIFIDLKFHQPREVKWSQLGGFVRGRMGEFSLVDREGRKVAAADFTMPNYYDFYNMAIRRCKDYKKEQKREKTGKFGEEGGRLRMEPGYIVAAVLIGFGISVLVMTGLVELSKKVPEIGYFVQSLSMGKVCLIMMFLPTVAVCLLLLMYIKRYWKYSDYGLELSYVFRKKVELGWEQIKRVEIGVMKSVSGENYDFVLYTFDGINSAAKYSSRNLLTQGNHDFKLQVERMAELYGFEVVMKRLD